MNKVLTLRILLQRPPRGSLDCFNGVSRNICPGLNSLELAVCLYTCLENLDLSTGGTTGVPPYIRRVDLNGSYRPLAALRIFYSDIYHP